MSERIWSKKPADTGAGFDREGWNEAYPIGNGSVGAMVYGDPVLDVLALNEENIWYGSGGRDRVNPRAKDAYPEVRRLLLEGRIREAQDIVGECMFATEEHQRSYSTAENVWFEYEHGGDYGDYERELDIENAVARVSYSADGHKYVRECFVSAPENVLILRHTSSDGGKTSCKIDFSRRTEETYKYEKTDYGLIISAKTPEGGCEYRIAAACVNDGGALDATDNIFELSNVDGFTLYIAIRTDLDSGDEDVGEWCSRTVRAALNVGYGEHMRRHTEEYKSYFDRVSLTLDGRDDDDVPTADRLASPDAGLGDVGLARLYFDFGRYLLISSSRPGTKPANLQGIWNKDHRPAWGSKFTININTEMNYWPAEVTNLSECHMPLFEHLKTMLPNGQRVAKEMYGLDGFVAHHNTDIFGDCAPQDYCMSATIWPLGAAWLCTHIMTHYDFTLDIDFLREYYPILRESCRFFTGYLFEHDGKLLSGPSISPENSYRHPSGEVGQMCVGPTMDSMIIRDIFEGCIRAASLLGVEDELTSTLSDMLPKLPKPSIGRYGQIMEWSEDYEETEPGHRHISHLYGLYPSSQFSFTSTPELMRAARVTLERRLSNGGGHTGWSRAWIINMWARLRDGEKAGENVSALLTRSTYTNMLDRHPPFQIDGNFGGAAGIAEMLLQSHDGTITLLPALPKSWATGSFTGLRARGNVTVDAEWQNGNVTRARFTAHSGGRVRVALSDGVEFEAERACGFDIVYENGAFVVENI